VAGLPEFPDDVLAACEKHYRRPREGNTDFTRFRRNGRSFPTDYPPMPQELFGTDNAEALRAHVVRVAAELDELGGIGKSRLVGRIRQARQSTQADKRVFAGPSDADAAALSHIEQAWCMAEFICAETGLRVDTWTKDGLRRARVRYGLLLDWATRDVAQRLARERDGLGIEDAYELYGLDPVRVALEHGAEPDELDALAEAASLRRRGFLCSWGSGQASATAQKLRSERLAQVEPGFSDLLAVVEAARQREFNASD
jgi:hypothetical protein